METDIFTEEIVSLEQFTITTIVHLIILRKTLEQLLREWGDS